MADKQFLLDKKAHLTRERASLLDWLSRLQTSGATDQAATQQRNLMELERQLAQVERELARL